MTLNKIKGNPNQPSPNSNYNNVQYSEIINWIINNQNPKGEYIKNHLECNDGIKISIQANGELFHCITGVSVEIGPLMYKNEEEDHKLLLDYYLGEEDIYTYVPLQLLQLIINKHGGIKYKINIPTKQEENSTSIPDIIVG